MAQVVLKIGDPLAAVSFRDGGITWSRGINGLGTAKFKVKANEVTGSHAVLSEGSPVQIEVGGTAVWDGMITKISEEIAAGSGMKDVTYGCIGTEIWLRDRLVTDSWASGTAIATIFSNVVTDYLASDGFSDNSMSGGPSLGSALEVKGVNVIELFDQLRDIAIDQGAQEYFWRVNVGKEIEFNVRGSASAAWDIPNTGGSSPIRFKVLETNREKYKNSVLVRGAANGRGDFTETITAGENVGDTTVNQVQRRFKVSRPILYLKSVKVDGVPFQIGRDGNADLDLDADFTFVPGSRIVLAVRDVVDVGDSVEIKYVAETQIDVSYTDSAKVSARASAEGGSGKYEKKIEDTRILTESTAEAIARSYVDIFGQIPQIISYETNDVGLDPGDVQTITKANQGLSSADFIITDVTGSVRGSTRANFKIKATTGFAMNRWGNIFRTFLAKQSEGPGADDLDQSRDRVYFEELVADTFMLFDNGTEVVPDGGTQRKKFRYESGKINPFG